MDFRSDYFVYTLILSWLKGDDDDDDDAELASYVCTHRSLGFLGSL